MSRRCDAELLRRITRPAGEYGTDDWSPSIAQIRAAPGVREVTNKPEEPGAER